MPRSAPVSSCSSNIPGAEVVDCTDRIVMPGMVNTHTHLFQTLLKGLGDDMVLKKWFTCMTGPAQCTSPLPDAHAAALHGCVESIRSGVTTVVDFMYVHPQAGHDHLRGRDAFQMTGMRGFVCRGFISDGVQYGIPEALIEQPVVALATQRADTAIQQAGWPGAGGARSQHDLGSK